MGMLRGVRQMYQQEIVLGPVPDHCVDPVLALKRQPKVTTHSSSPPAYITQELSDTLSLTLFATPTKVKMKL